MVESILNAHNVLLFHLSVKNVETQVQLILIVMIVTMTKTILLSFNTGLLLRNSMFVKKKQEECLLIVWCLIVKMNKYV